MSVNIINVLLENQKGKESLMKNKSYAIIKPLEFSILMEKTGNTNLNFYRYPKVIFKTNKGLLEVNQGNHNIVNLNETILQGSSRNIFIFHFPVRGIERFRHKAIETGMAVEKNLLLGKSQSVHIRRWFDAYKSGTLDKEYEKLTFSKHAAENFKEAGIIADFDFLTFTNDKRNDDLIYQIQKNQIDYEITDIKQIITDLNHSVADLNQTIADLNQTVADRDGQITALNAELGKIKSSLSWKLTMPLHFGGSLLRGYWAAIRKHLSRSRDRSNGKSYEN
jgi:hypothetical protein